MKIIKGTIIVFIIISMIFSCDKEPPTVINMPPEVTETEDSIPVEIEQCVDEELITRWDGVWMHFEGSPQKVFVEAIKQNKTWKAYGLATSNYSANFVRTFYDSTETRTAELFTIRYFNKAIGCYPIRQITFPLDSLDMDGTIYVDYTFVDLDVNVDDYRVDENATNNHFEVLEVDSVNHLIKGKFACTFIKEPIEDLVFNPDTLRFFNGYFELEFGE